MVGLTRPRADARIKFAPEFLVDPVALQPRLHNVLAVLLRAACSAPLRRHGGHAAMPLSRNGYATYHTIRRGISKRKEGRKKT